MDARMRKALKESVVLWERRAEGEEAIEKCPLCVEAQDRIDSNKEGTYCPYCPVYKETEEIGCVDTPYFDWYEDQTPANAQKEVDFLKSLLKEEVMEYPEAKIIDSRKISHEEGVIDLAKMSHTLTVDNNSSEIKDSLGRVMVSIAYNSPFTDKAICLNIASCDWVLVKKGGALYAVPQRKDK